MKDILDSVYYLNPLFLCYAEGGDQKFNISFMDEKHPTSLLIPKRLTAMGPF
jgi:hypothetical protein